MPHVFRCLLSVTDIYESVNQAFVPVRIFFYALNLPLINPPALFPLVYSHYHSLVKAVCRATHPSIHSYLHPSLYPLTQSHIHRSTHPSSHTLIFTYSWDRSSNYSLTHHPSTHISINPSVPGPVWENTMIKTCKVQSKVLSRRCVAVLPRPIRLWKTRVVVRHWTILVAGWIAVLSTTPALPYITVHRRRDFEEIRD